MKFASTKIAHLEPLVNFKIVSATDSKYHIRSTGAAAGTAGTRLRDGHEQPFADRMHLQFDIFDKTFSHELEIDTDMFEPHSKITLYKEGKIQIQI
jgi:hypothetical protein